MKKQGELPFLRTEYNYDRNAASQESAIRFHKPTLTKQSFADESDINFIADRFGLTGELPTIADQPIWGAQFNEHFDFQKAQNAVIAAKQDFMTLPAKLRARFHNNPSELLAFLDNPDNRDEAAFLGLMEKRPEEVPQSTVAAPGAKTGASPAPDPDDSTAATTAKTGKKPGKDT